MCLEMLVRVRMTNDTEGLELKDLSTEITIQKGFVQGSYHQQGLWDSACLSFRSPAQGKMRSKDWAHLGLWKWKSLSRVWFFATPRTIQSMESSRPEYWSGQPFPSPGDLPNPGIKPRSPALQADSLPAELPGKPPWSQRDGQFPQDSHSVSS